MHFSEIYETLLEGQKKAVVAIPIAVVRNIIFD